MYQVNYLPSAMDDMVEIVTYIRHTLQNPHAAAKIMDTLYNGAEGLRQFPYANPAYFPQRPLEHEYRKLLIGSYLMFYWIEEETKTVTVSRVVYASQNYEKSLQ